MNSSNSKFNIRTVLIIFILVALVGAGVGFMGGIAAYGFYPQVRDYLSQFDLELPAPPQGPNQVVEKEYVLRQDQVVTEVVKDVSPAVVSIIITKDLPVFEKYYPFEEFFGPGFRIPQYRQKGTEEKEIGGGTGFFVSKDGMILTNKHVVMDKQADYTVLTNQGEKLPAQVLATDPFQDIALLKVNRDQTLNDQGKVEVKDFPVVELGDSDRLEPGQTVIAIGNALGEFRNTVSVGVVSGLKRTVTATGGGMVEVLENLIQTDAAINRGNSGGPLLNLKGEVMGINTAMAQSAENIGFAIPINKAKRDIDQVKRLGKIVYPFLGIRYTMITKQLQQNYDLPVDYGAWIGRNRAGQKVKNAIVPDSAADKAGLKPDDIILEFDHKKLTTQDTLADVIVNYEPEDQVELKILRDGQEMTIKVTLGERSE